MHPGDLFGGYNCICSAPRHPGGGAPKSPKNVSDEVEREDKREEKEDFHVSKINNVDIIQRPKCGGHHQNMATSIYIKAKAEE